MKEAMWSVDPQAGGRYTARTDSGQDVLFQLAVDTSPLLAELRDAFADQWFSVAQAEEVTLLRTPYLPKRHLMRLTLVPAEKAGVIEVERAQGSRAGTFTAEALMRFTGPSGETRA
jgi:hypothetical protein